MWSRIPIYLWPSVWLSAFALGLATATAYRLSAMPVLHNPPKLRTPLLSLHVCTLRPNPHAGQIKPSRWLRRPLHLVKPGCEDN